MPAEAFKVNSNRDAGSSEQTFEAADGLTIKMRILRCLSSRRMPCGCLVGIYETYDAEIVAVLDARGAACDDDRHVPGDQVAAEVLSPAART